MPEEKKNEKRLDPDVILQKIQKAARGKLTLFLGAAAGVGKTYAMLEAAHERLQNSVDVAIGWVETHKRKETEELVHGLPLIPPARITYRGKELLEMDIDAILARKPELVLVDELAHTNVPGSRHVRRYQDIEELLDAGINVYSALNIQHLESLNDIVEQITGVKVRETVPDHILEKADQIRLVDIPPEELIQRLKEGKVYVPHQAERALHKFFRPGNINALRELALRSTAAHVDKDLHEYMRDHDIQGPWPAAERVMVCVSPSPFSAQLVRAARRLAAGMKAEWIAVYIENPRSAPMGEQERDRLMKNLRLAEELGAKTITTVGRDVAEELLALARTHHITQLIIGKPLRSSVKELLYGSIINKVIRGAEGISLHVIPGKAGEERPVNIARALPPVEHFSWLNYAGSLLMLAVITGINLGFRQELELVNIALLYLVPVLFSALRWGVGPAIASSLCGAVLFDFLFIPPVFSFSIYDIRYSFSFIMFVIVGFVVGKQAERLRQQAVQARQGESRTRTLYNLSREIAAVSKLDTIVKVVIKRAVESFNREVSILLPDVSGRLLQWGIGEPDQQAHPQIETVGIVNAHDGEMHLIKQPLEDASEQAVAVWVMEHGESAGRGTETLPGAKYIYIPLKTEGKIMGVLGVRLPEKQIPLEHRDLLEAFAGLAAVGIERARLAEQAKQTALLAESERLRTALFNSVSHELRTPLSSIIGATSGLLDKKADFSEAARQELLETIRDGAARMERLIANLLDTARMESGMMQLKSDWCDIQDIIGTSLRRMGDTIKDISLSIDIPENMPLIWADCVLLEQVIVNLLDNAVKYSPKGSAIDMRASFNSREINVSISDKGLGIPPEDLERVFDKFYRLKCPQNVTGTGLGLSICKGIIEAHGGRIWAENSAGGGTSVKIALPLGKEQPKLADEIGG